MELRTASIGDCCLGVVEVERIGRKQRQRRIRKDATKASGMEDGIVKEHCILRSSSLGKLVPICRCLDVE